MSMEPVSDTDTSRDFAVVIGIEHYPRMQDNPAESAHADARRFHDWLMETARLPEVNTRLILGEEPPAGAAPGEPLPHQLAIDSAFMELFTLAKSEGAHRLYVYFAGHGASRRPDHVALMLAGCSEQYPNYSLNAAMYQNGLLNQGLFAEQFFFYDCCRPFDWRFKGSEPSWFSPLPDPAAGEVEQRVYYAARFTEKANARIDAGGLWRGLFTQALLEGLRGTGDSVEYVGDEQWGITGDSLGRYMEWRLPELAGQRGASQRLGSCRVGKFRDPLLITRPPPASVPVVLRAGTPAKEVLVRDCRYRVLQSVPVVDGKAQADLSPGEYIFEAQPQPAGAVSSIVSHRVIAPVTLHF